MKRFSFATLYLACALNIYSATHEGYTSSREAESVYTEHASRFSLWSPMADSVRLNIYADAESLIRQCVKLNRQPDGTWTETLQGDHKGMYYTFQIKTQGRWQPETPGIFARAVGVNGKRAQLLDMRDTDPAGWDSDRRPAMSSPADVVLYEMHHRDFSVDPASGMVNKGKFLALSETGTKNGEGLSTGLDHLRELGVTHVHLLPSYDFGSIDEKTGLAVSGGGRDHVCKYNWGYDPVNYNVPEGSYSTDAADPARRIREFKEMVMAMHKAGLRVVLDVVYNHVFDLGQSNFNLTAPGYFFRCKADGSPANGSGCGNETASEQAVMRQFMVESVKYWMQEYHIDGFRFDLMGIHDIETMNAIRLAAQAVDPNVFIYGEGWAAEAPALSSERLAMKANTSKLGGIAAFGDEMRDGLRGGWQDDHEGAFLIGKAGNEESVKFGIVGAIPHPGVDMQQVNYSKEAWAAQPTQMISYVSCHDDMCLADRIVATAPKADIAERVRLQKLAETVVLTSQGVPFIWCGDEIMRDRKGVHNCYASPDSINQIPWSNKTLYKEVFDYMRSLIQLRKDHRAFRMGDAEAVRANLSFLPVKSPNVIAYTIDGKAVGDKWADIVVIVNSNRKPVSQSIPAGEYSVVVGNGKVDVNGLGRVKGNKVTVPAQTAMIIVRR